MWKACYGTCWKSRDDSCYQVSTTNLRGFSDLLVPDTQSYTHSVLFLALENVVWPILLIPPGELVLLPLSMYSMNLWTNLIISERSDLTCSPLSLVNAVQRSELCWTKSLQCHREWPLRLLVRVWKLTFSQSRIVISRMGSSILDYISSPPHEGLILCDSAAVKLLVQMFSSTDWSLEPILTFESYKFRWPEASSNQKLRLSSENESSSAEH